MYKGHFTALTSTLLISLGVAFGLPGEAHGGGAECAVPPACR